MDLLNAVQTDSLEKIKEIVGSKGIPVNAKWLDYAVLNSAIECGRSDVAMFLLTHKKLRVNKTTKSDEPLNTPLHSAIKLGDLDLICSLLNKKSLIDVVNADGDTPLHIAFMTRRDNIVDALLDYIENTSNYANVANDHGLTHMHIACARNKGEIVEKFLEAGAELDDCINAKSSLWPGYTAMHFAVQFESLEVVTVLKRAHNSTNIEDSNGYNPLKLAYEKLKNLLSMVHILTNEDVQPTQLSHFHLACLRDDPAAVETFVKNGADVNLQVSRTAVFCPLYSPLHCAVESNCKKNVELLLARGADVKAQNDFAMTPLHLALYNEDHKQKDTIVDLLYKAMPNKDVDCPDLNGLSFFHIAVTRNDIRLVNKLLNRNADYANDPILYNLRKFSHFTPLHFSALYGHVEMSDLLIQRGCNFNREDSGRYGTPLHLAIEIGNRGVVDLLLARDARTDKVRFYDCRTTLHLLVELCVNESEDHWGLEYVERLTAKCDVNARDVDGNTALHLACAKLHSGGECARLLLEFGADLDVKNEEGKTPFDVSFVVGCEVDFENHAMLYEHVQKLKALGIKVNPKNEVCCEKLAKGGQLEAEELARMQRQIRDEIDKLKATRLTQRVTLLDFLVLEPRRVMQYVQNKVLMSTVELMDLDEQYPMYAYLIKLRYQEGMEHLEAYMAEKRAAKVELNANGGRRAKRRRW